MCINHCEEFNYMMKPIKIIIHTADTLYKNWSLADTVVEKIIEFIILSIAYSYHIIAVGGTKPTFSNSVNNFVDERLSNWADKEIH